MIQCLPLVCRCISSRSSRWYWDPDDPEDVLKVNADAETGEGGDDCYDAVRYAVCSRPISAPPPVDTEPLDIWSLETLAAERERLVRRGPDLRTEVSRSLEFPEFDDLWP